MNNENNLNNWDIKLLKKHLEFYLGLESGKISIDEDGDKVDKIKRKHFIEVLNNKQSPKTQHEIAFLKWIKAGRPNLSNQVLKTSLIDLIAMNVKIKVSTLSSLVTQRLFVVRS